MTFRTLGEAVLAAHRAQEEQADHDHDIKSESRSEAERSGPSGTSSPIGPADRSPAAGSRRHGFATERSGAGGGMMRWDQFPPPAWMEERW